MVPTKLDLSTEDVVVAEVDALSSASSEVISDALSIASSGVISDVLSETADEHYPSGTYSEDIGFHSDESTPSHSEDAQLLPIDEVVRSLPPLGSPSQPEPEITDMSTGEAEGDSPSSEVVQHSNPDNPLNSVIPQNDAATSSKGEVDKAAIADLTELPEAAPATSVAPRDELTAYQLSLILGVSDRTIITAAAKGNEHFRKWVARYNKGIFDFKVSKSGSTFPKRLYFRLDKLPVP